MEVSIKLLSEEEVASLYQSFLGDVSDLSLPAAPGSDPDRFDTFQNYEMEAERRDELKLYLLDKNIGTLIQWGVRLFTISKSRLQSALS